jgi:hypothetical protein
LRAWYYQLHGLGNAALVLNHVIIIIKRCRFVPFKEQVRVQWASHPSTSRPSVFFFANYFWNFETAARVTGGVVVVVAHDHGWRVTVGSCGSAIWKA